MLLHPRDEHDQLPRETGAAPPGDDDRLRALARARGWPEWRVGRFVADWHARQGG